MRYAGLIFLFVLLSCSSNPVMPPTALQPAPALSQLQWHDMEMNAFVHFTTNTFTGKEWGYGDESPAIFQPTAFDATQWIRTFKAAGFKGVILTCKHHDGFCLWPSKYTEHSVKNSPWKNGKGDVVRAVADACHAEGLLFGIYVSPWDRNHKDYGSPAYVAYYRDQLMELFTNYGPIFEMWFDGANGGDGFYGGARKKRSINGATYYDWPATLNQIEKQSPGIIFFSDAGPGVRWVGNEKGIAGETNWNTITADTLYAGKARIESLLNTGSEKGTDWIPAEVDVSIRPGWFYHPEEDTLVKSAQQLFDIYLTSVGRGSTLLLNVPPDRRGRIHKKDSSFLMEFRKLIDSTFHHNLALRAAITTSSHRGNSDTFSASMLNDQNNQTYWATGNSALTGNIDIKFDQPKTVRYIVLQEYLPLGQRVKSFSIQAERGNRWNNIARGTTVGHKRIIRIDPVETAKLRIQFEGKACLAISNVEVY